MKPRATEQALANLAKNVYTLRINLGYSPGDLAARAEVSEKQILTYEAGKSYPHAKTLIRLARALEVTPESLSQDQLQALEPHHPAFNAVWRKTFVQWAADHEGILLRWIDVQAMVKICAAKGVAPFPLMNEIYGLIAQYGKWSGQPIDPELCTFKVRPVPSIQRSSARGEMRSRITGLLFIEAWPRQAFVQEKPVIILNLNDQGFLGRDKEKMTLWTSSDMNADLGLKRFFERMGEK